MRYEYRVSESVILRQPDPADAWKLEAWSEKEGNWFVYPWIYNDWQTASRPMDEQDVPSDARLAPSSYEVGKDESLSGDETDGPNGGFPPRLPLSWWRTWMASPTDLPRACAYDHPLRARGVKTPAYTTRVTARVALMCN